MDPEWLQNAEVDPRFLALARSLIDHPIICDIGSRDAREGIVLLRSLGAKRLHVFEANPMAALQCRRNLALLPEPERERVEFNEIAVADRQGVAPFYPVDLERSSEQDIGFSSPFKLHPAYVRRRRRIVQREIQVPTTTLDHYFAEREPPDILWIDVEGGEKRVLEGACRILGQVRLIQLEVSLRPMHIDRPLFWEIDGILRDFGFEFAFFQEVSRLPSFLYRKKWWVRLPWRLNAIYC